MNWTYTITVLSTLVGLVLLYLSIFQWNILRDDMPPDVPKKDRPFSLSRVQMMWWLVIVFSSFVIIMTRLDWMVVEGSKVFSQTAVLLLGIGTATVAVARSIDNADRRNAKQLRHQERTGAASGNLLTDICSDENGWSVHRLQKALFTITFGLIFLTSCAAAGVTSMPEFDPEWLALIGVSSGGYLAIKSTENKVAA